MSESSRRSIFKDIAGGDTGALDRAAQLVRGPRISPPQDDYAAFARMRARAADGGEVFFNSAPAHMGVVVRVLLEAAVEVVEILTGSLDAMAYGSDMVAQEAVNFLKRGQGRIKILSEVEIEAELNPMLRAIKNANLIERVELWSVPLYVQKQYTCHFAVVDGRSFRFQARRDRFEAIVKFGDRTIGSALRQNFAAIEAVSVRQGL